MLVKQLLFQKENLNKGLRFRAKFALVPVHFCDCLNTCLISLKTSLKRETRLIIMFESLPTFLLD